MTVTTESGVNKKIIRNYINIAIIFGVMIAFHFIPAPAPITTLGMQVIGIFIGMIYGWMTCGMLWPSLAGILMLGFSEYCASPEAALGMALTNATAMMMLVAFIAFNYVAGTGLTEWIATWLITRKFTIGKPWVFMIFLWVAGILIAGVFNVVILIIMMFEFVIPLFKEMGYTKDDMFPVYMLLGISANLGLCTVWPAFLPHSIYTRGIIASALGHPLTTLQYTMCIAVPLLTMVVTYIFVGKFILRIDTSKFKAGSAALAQKMQENKGKGLTTEQKHGAIVLALFILGCAVPAILPTTWPIISTLNRMGVVGVSTLTVIAVIVLMKKDGTTLTTFDRLMHAMDWNMILLTAAIMTIAASITSQGTGIVAYLSMVIIPLLSKMSVLGFVILVMIVMCIVSQFSMNMVLQMIFAPILGPILLQAGYNPMIAVMAVYFGTQLAFLAPSGSMMAAMVFAKTDWVKPRNLYKICAVWIPLTMVIWVIMTLTFPNIFCPM